MTNQEIFRNFSKKIKDAIKINRDNLDEEALRIPELIVDIHDILADEASDYQKLQREMAKLEKIRHRYYSGKGSADDYNKEPLPDIILKSDIDKYLKADKLIQEQQARMEWQMKRVKLVEDALATVKSRSYQIRDAIEYRKFLMGV